MSDDASLVRRPRPAIVAGLGALLERHRALLHAVAVGMLGAGPQAEDAVHDTFLIALRRIGDLRDPPAARAWLLAILGNVCRAQLRRATARADGRVPEPPAAQPVEARSTGSRCATGCGRRSTACRHRCGSRSCCATSAARAPTTRSPTSPASRSAPSAAGSAPRAPSSPTRCSRRPPSATRRPRASWRSPPVVAMTALQRTGDASAGDDVFREDLRFRMADRVRAAGPRCLRRRIVRDLEDGVNARVRNVVVGADLAVIELWLDSPPDRPLHCRRPRRRCTSTTGTQTIGSSRTTRAPADSTA
jgi:RNA polymerase sigma-70 factor (ECF subfamily)